ncbi:MULTISPECIES: hypothetical protein [unclassified Ekhidna]|jgi:uncharacterized protein YihD (DUF1040 family)|uniref:hypothetical protein n=1 Tax=unclassified Ekhidna TaxID=2632188 RepID=UPI0032DFD4C8
MRWYVLIFILLCSCTAYNHNFTAEEVTLAQLEKINADDKVLLVLREEIDEKRNLRGRFESVKDDLISIKVKRQGENQTIQIPISNIRKIKYEENVPATVLKATLGITGSVFVVAFIVFLNDPNIGTSGI